MFGRGCRRIGRCLIGGQGSQTAIAVGHNDGQCHIGGFEEGGHILRVRRRIPGDHCGRRGLGVIVTGNITTGGR